MAELAPSSARMDVGTFGRLFTHFRSIQDLAWYDQSTSVSGQWKAMSIVLQPIFDERTFELVLSNPLFQESRLLKWGSSSVLLTCDEHHVFRLSLDSATQFCASVAQATDIEAVVRIYEDYGAIGDVGADEWIWLSKLERLEEIRANSEAEDQITAFFEILAPDFEEGPIDSGDLIRFQERLSAIESPPLLKKSTSALIALLPIMHRYGIDCDWSASNYMWRTPTRSIVLADPAHSGLPPSWERRQQLTSSELLLDPSKDPSRLYAL
jgi:hypothetical protein